MESRRESALTAARDVMDRGNLAPCLWAVVRRDAILRTKQGVVHLRPPAHDRREGVADGAHVPGPDARALGGVDHDELTRRGDEDLVPSVEVRVGPHGPV